MRKYYSLSRQDDKGNRKMKVWVTLIGQELRHVGVLIEDEGNTGLVVEEVIYKYYLGLYNQLQNLHYRWHECFC